MNPTLRGRSSKAKMPVISFFIVGLYLHTYFSGTKTNNVVMLA